MNSGQVPVLVTGASGFIGRHLTMVLERKGLRVRRAVRVPSQPGDVPLGDIGPDSDWTAAVEGVGAIVHLAGRAHVFDPGAADEEAFFRVNVGGLESLCRAAAQAGIPRLVFLSSVSVLGNRTTPGEVLTEAAPLRPVGAYARSKALAEDRLRDWGAKTGLETVSLRPPMVYGPDAPGNFDRLVSWMERGIPLPFASIQNLRSFIYIENLCDALVQALLVSKLPGSLYHVTDGEDLSTPDLIRRVAQQLGTPARLFPFPSDWLKKGLTGLGRKGLSDKLLESFRIDASAFQRDFHWTPPFRVEEGLKRAFSLKK